MTETRPTFRFKFQYTHDTDRQTDTLFLEGNPISVLSHCCQQLQNLRMTLYLHVVLQCGMLISPLAFHHNYRQPEEKQKTK